MLCFLCSCSKMCVAEIKHSFLFGPDLSLLHNAVNVTVLIRDIAGLPVCMCCPLPITLYQHDRELWQQDPSLGEAGGRVPCRILPVQVNRNEVLYILGIGRIAFNKYLTKKPWMLDVSSRSFKWQTEWLVGACIFWNVFRVVPLLCKPVTSKWAAFLLVVPVLQRIICNILAFPEWVDNCSQCTLCWLV